jgi:hypothetical protein
MRECPGIGGSAFDRKVLLFTALLTPDFPKTQTEPKQQTKN